MLTKRLPLNLKTVTAVGCIVLFCTFYWDVRILHYLYHSTRPIHSSPTRLNNSFGWTWKCMRFEDNIDTCQRVFGNLRSKAVMSLTTCSMTCSPGRNIWPFPTGDVKIKNTTASFLPRSLKVEYKPVDDKATSNVLKKTVKVFQDKITKLARKSNSKLNLNTFTVVIQLKKKDKGVGYKLNIDESYKITVKQKGSKVEALIQASTFLGAHHGLETLIQIVWWDEHDKLLKVLSNAVISDAPFFTYRGLMLDTAKHFLPVKVIQQTVNAMSMVKMNVMHWHLTGSESFLNDSIQFPGFKKYGLYSKSEIYTLKEIAQVVEYAEVRGVTVLIEAEFPGHTQQQWELSEEERKVNVTLCSNDQPHAVFCSEPPCGHLNPANDDALTTIVRVIKELNNFSKVNDLIHLGGDDVSVNCWGTSDEVANMEVLKGTGIWEVFYKRLFDKLSQKKISLRNAILWSNAFLTNSNLFKSFKAASPIVQSKGPSTSAELDRLVRKKYRVIVSSSDLWRTSEPQSWSSVYKYRPWADMNQQQKKLVLGGEALAWSDSLTLHTSLWPTTAAVAERLWSDPRWGSAPLARFSWLRERLVEGGVPSSPVGPKWCSQNPFQCS